MAADFDDTTEDFFDNLVNSDDDDDRPSRLPPPPAEEDLAALTLTDRSDAGQPDNQAPPPPANPPQPATEEALLEPEPEPEPAVAPPPAPAAAPDKGAPALKQARWNDFGASTGAAEVDPFGDLPPGEAEDAFFGGAAAAAGDQGRQESLPGATNASAPVHGFSAGTTNNANDAADYSFYGATDNNTANSQFDSTAVATGYGADRGANSQLESADPRYLESLYPGWKYDDATQQWYQVQDTPQHITSESTSDMALLGTNNVQQQLSASRPQNNAEAADESTQDTPQPKPLTEADDQPAQAPHKHDEEEREPTLPHPQAEPVVEHPEAASASDHGFSPGADNNATAAAGLPDYSFYGTTDNNAANSQFDKTTGDAGYGDQSTNAQLESADPRYLESLYPGWKYDDATQQWYQVDTLSAQHITAETTSDGAVVGSDNVQQQQHSASYLQNDSHTQAMLEPTVVTPQPKPVTEADDQPTPVPAPHKEEVELEPTPMHPHVEPVVEHPEVATDAAVQHPDTKSEVQETPASAEEAAMAPESGSPGSQKGIHTAIKQVQWNDFGASTSAIGADPFGDLLPDGAENDFFGATVPGDQGVQASVVGTSNVSKTDHSFSAGVNNSAAISAGLADYSFSGGMDNSANSHFDSSTSAVGYGDQSTNGQLDSTDPKYLESLYPGWKYDATTQQWYQVDTPSAQSYVADNTGAVAVLGSEVQQQQQQFNTSYLQHSALETIAEESNVNAANWGAAPVEYPPNMLFYAEYPGWYFDTNTQQWQSLESYQQSVAQAATTPSASDGIAGAGHSVAHYTQDSYASSYNQQSQWQPGSLGNTMQPDVSGGNNLLGSSYNSNRQAENQIGQQANVESLQPSINYKPHTDTFVPSAGQYAGSEGNQASYEGFKPFTGNQSWYKGSEHSASQEVGYKNSASSTDFHTGHKEFQLPKDHQAGHMAYKPSTRVGYGNSNGPQDFVPKESMYKTQTHTGSSAHTYVPNNYGGTQTAMDFSQQQLIGTDGASQQFGFSPHEQRSSAGRPPHAVVTFGFGGKLVVLKQISSITANFESRNQGDSGRAVSVLNIPEIIGDKIDNSSVTNGSAISYFHALCCQPIPGPLVGGSAASKDVNKWLDDMIGVYESSLTEFQRGDVQKVLISLLKILCQHYGKLRSPFGSDPSQEGIDGPDMAVTKLLSSCKSSANMKGYGVHCMRNLPSESQIQATAQEVQNLLVSGRRKEALQYAQEGQLWGPALILALQLGDKFYADTVKKMAHCHFVSGSPLRTLCLLIAGQPADVFNSENPVNSGALYTPHQPVEVAPKGMLDDWQENLAIITANRTKGDDLVITHLGDCLWKEKNEVASAHSCYLVAELNIDSYSESARMCLIGADHLRCPRTFASPVAIQRMEVYEYAKVLGNSQYILLPFQPYKLVYAYMLAEIGKVSDSLRYCQASLKVLKASGRTPELEAWKQLFSTLEERIRTHQQGGYATNLAPGKIVGKLFTSLDKSLSRMMGTQSAPPPPPPQGSAHERNVYSPLDTKVVNNQSEMTMSPLMSSASEQSMSEMAGNSGPGREVSHNRSISEPDFGRTPQKAAGSSKAQSTSGSGSSRFGWLVQKTVGLVSKSHRQAKLGEQNKFYYDEKLKRWVEEGAEVPAEEPPLPPPPTKSSFQNSIPETSLNGPPVGGGYSANGFAEAKTSNPLEPSSGMPPMPPTQNQFSARGRMGVRSRYVDTFNKGGGGGGANAFGAAAMYSKPTAPSMSPLSGAKFFVPTPATVASEQTAVDATADAHSETAQQDEPSSSAAVEAAFSSPAPPVPMQSAIQRYPSGDNIQRYPSMDNIMAPSDSVSSSMSRSRASSWSGTYPEQLSSTAVSRSPDGQTMRSPMMPGMRPPHSRSSSNSSLHQFNGLGEDLHEVEL
ncbi:unnamed protein product [Urochloa humidicola]